jgi:2-aminoadipate transaminase
MVQALEQHFGAVASRTRPHGGLFIWATLEGDVDTTDLLARSEGVAFVPGRAAYVDGRSGSASMRLNFAGVAEDDIREGMRRIGEALGDRAGLLGALTGSPARSAGVAQAEEPTVQEPSPDPGLADVLQLPLRDQTGQTRRRRDR